MRDQFNNKVFKVMLDAGFTCPNRDGSIAKGAVPSAVHADQAILQAADVKTSLASSIPFATGNI